MWNPLRPKPVEVLNHWYALVPGLKASPQDFYTSIEERLKERQVPGLELSRVEFAEGGILSAKRQYLRMTRERLVFDVCSAPFGTSYFFSCRFAEIPAVIRVWQLILIFMGLYFIAIYTWKLAGIILGTFLLAAGCILLVYILRNAVSLGMQDVDASLIKSPVFGPVYELLFRKETYYREDTRLMYLDTVNDVVKSLVEETAGVKGIKLLRFNEHDPILHEIYKPRFVELPKQQQPE